MTNAERIQAHNAELQECLKIAKSLPDATISGVEMNLAFGGTPPEDTSKIWVKGAVPDKVTCTSTPTLTENIVPVRTDFVNALPYKVYNCYIYAVGNKIYCLGGQNDGGTNSSDNAQNIDNITVIDTETNIATELDIKLPYKGSPFAATVGKYLYLLNPKMGTSRLNTETNTFEYLTAEYPVTTTRHHVALDNKIYLFPTQDSRGEVLVYDTELDMYTTLVENFMKTDNTNIAANGRIYLFTNTKIYTFDPVTLLLTQVYYDSSSSTYNTVKDPYTCCYLGGREIYYGSPQTNWCGSMAVYDIYSNTARKFLSNSTIIYNVSECTCWRMAAVGTKLYAVGGRSRAGWNLSDTFAYVNFPNGKTEAEPGELQIYNNPTYGNVAAVVNDEKICIKSHVGGMYLGNADGVGESVESYIYKNENWEPLKRRY